MSPPGLEDYVGREKKINRKFLKSKIDIIHFQKQKCQGVSVWQLGSMDSDGNLYYIFLKSLYIQHKYKKASVKGFLITNHLCQAGFERDFLTINSLVKFSKRTRDMSSNPLAVIN